MSALSVFWPKSRPTATGHMQTLDPSMAGYWRRTKIRKLSRGEWEKDKLVLLSFKTSEACQRCRIATNRSRFYWMGTET